MGSQQMQQTGACATESEDAPALEGAAGTVAERTAGAAIVAAEVAAGLLVAVYMRDMT